MKRSVTNNLLLLIIFGANLCFLNTSCAQDPQPTCCKIFALETQINSIEGLTNELAKEKKHTPILSVWKKSQTFLQRPSLDKSVKKECENSNNRPPSDYLKSRLGYLLDLREKALSNYLEMIITDRCGQDDVSYYEPQMDIGQQRESIEGGRESVEGERDLEDEKEIVDNYNPKEFTSQQLSFEKELPFIAMDDVEYGRIGNEKKYICVIYDPKSKEYGVDFLYKAKDINGGLYRLQSFQNAVNYLKNSGRTPKMLMNAGMFNPSFEPVGLFYRNGEKSFDLNNKKGLSGNFYMDPGGVFAIKKDGTATISTRDALSKNPKDMMDFLYATQSGPMLVINGNPHPDFRSHSPNLKIRNGVGIMPDGKIVFAISKDEVNFFEFALLFRDGFKCKDALYLDGFVSKIYAPSINRLDAGGNFGGIIAIYKKKNGN
jgi:uncharacterized protein YigE (DUF2233 family)